MDSIEIVVEGTLRPDGTLVLDGKPNISPGRVTVILRQHTEGVANANDDWFQYLLAARKRMEEAGCHFMNDEEVQAHIDWLRESDQIDDLLRDAAAQRPKAEQS